MPKISWKHVDYTLNKVGTFLPGQEYTVTDAQYALLPKELFDVVVENVVQEETITKETSLDVYYRKTSASKMRKDAAEVGIEVPSEITKKEEVFNYLVEKGFVIKG